MILPKINPKQRLLLIASVVACLMVGTVWPSMHALMNAELALNIGNSYGRLLSAEVVLWALSSMIFSACWKKMQVWFMKNYCRLEIFETLILTAFCIFNLIHFNYIVYYLFDTVYGVMVGQLAGRACDNLRQFLFSDPQERIDAGNAADFYCNIGQLIGYGIAIIDPLTLWKGAIYTQADGVITINYFYLNACLIIFWVADLIRTYSSVKTYCFKYPYTVWKAYFISKDKELAENQNK